MPNRANFFTGQLPSEHKTRSNGINLNPELPMLTKVLVNEGYHTCNVGKLHFQHLAPHILDIEKLSLFPWNQLLIGGMEKLTLRKLKTIMVLRKIGSLMATET